MKQQIGIFHLTMIGLGGIIGSGWLFASMYAAQRAGTGALLAWGLGALLMLVFSMCLSELVSLYPQRGLLASICSFSHNKDFAFIISIANWLGTVAVIPAEALATARYLSWPSWSVIILILMYSALNSLGVKFFSKFNSTITLFKFFAPLATVAVLLWHGLNFQHFHSAELGHFHAIMGALIAGGIIYSFNGVQMIVNFTSEAKRPRRDIPIALFLSLALGLLLYLGLQVVFIGAANLHIDYRSPFVELIATLNMAWLVILLKADAAISPSGTSFSFIASSTRMLTAMSREGQLPKYLAKLHPKYQMSHRSLITNTIISLVLFAVFKTWVSLVLVVSTFHVISYLAGPLALAKLRLTQSRTERLFKLPVYWLICPIFFIVLSLLFMLAGFHNDMAITLICITFQALYLIINYRGRALLSALRRSCFLPIWLIIFTFFASFNANLIGVSVVALALYFIAIYAHQTDEKSANIAVAT